MPKPLALLFAILTVASLVALAGCIAYRNVWGILIFLLISMLIPVTAITLRRRMQH